MTLLSADYRPASDFMGCVMTWLPPDVGPARDFMARVLTLLPPSVGPASDFKYAECFSGDVHRNGLFIPQLSMLARPWALHA